VTKDEFTPDTFLTDGEASSFVRPPDLNDLCPVLPSFSFRALP
jgi:hypothetical protein